MTTFHTTEKGNGWVDVTCDTCRQGVILPTSDYGRRLADMFPHIHECGATV